MEKDERALYPSKGFLRPRQVVPLEEQLKNQTDSVRQEQIIGGRTPIITDFTRAVHDHSSDSQGGALTQSAFNDYTLIPQTILDEVAASTQAITTAAYADITNWSGTFNSSGGRLLFFLEFTYYRATSGNASNFKLVVDGTNETIFRQYTNELSSHKFCARTIAVTGVDAGEDIAVKLQAQAVTSGTTSFDANDWIRLTVLELP